MSSSEKSSDSQAPKTTQGVPVHVTKFENGHKVSSKTFESRDEYANKPTKK